MPSGLRSGMTQKSASTRGAAAVIAFAIATPADSSPWMQPTIKTRCTLAGLPISVTVSGRPSADIPNVVVRFTMSGDTATGADGLTGRTTRGCGAAVTCADDEGAGDAIASSVSRAAQPTCDANAITSSARTGTLTPPPPCHEIGREDGLGRPSATASLTSGDGR